MIKRRIKDIAKISTGQTPPRDNDNNFSENSVSGNCMWIKPEDMHTKELITNTREYITSDGLKYIKKYNKESVIFNGIGGGVGNVALADREFTTNQQNHILYNCKNYKYLYYYLIANKIEISQLSTGNVVPILNGSRLKNFIIFDDSNEVLNRITNYLDKTCFKIEHNITALEKKSILLDEYKNALIYETVTKGLDKNSEMKDSGVEWIGHVPSHWNISRVKNILTNLNKSIFASGDSDDGEYNFYVSGKKIKKISKFNLDKTAILLPTGGTFITHFNDNERCAYSTDVLALLLKNKNYNLKFYYYLFSSSESFFNKELFYGSGLKHLNRKGLFSTIVPVPLLKEQNNIVNYLDIETNKIEKQIELINKKVELLKEYKQSLIYEAVTGQLDIE